MPLKRFFQILLVALVTAAVTYTVRSLIVEPRTMHEQCVLQIQTVSALCTVRQALVMGFVLNLYSIASLVLGLAGLGLRAHKCAWAAIVLGVIGALLYRVEFAALGLLCGALALARAPVTPQERQRSQ